MYIHEVGIDILVLVSPIPKLQLNPGMSVILFLLPEAEVEGNENDITQVTGIQLASIPVYNM